MSGGKRMTSFVVVAVGIYAAFVGALFLFQRNMLYFPDSSVPSQQESRVAEMDTVTLKTADGLELRSWYRPAAKGNPTIVFFQGNAGHIGYRGFKARLFMDAGFGVLLVGYRGYGGNRGKPTEQGLYADGRASLAFLESRGVGPAVTVLYGESLGSGVAVQLAVERAGKEAFAAVVLEAPFTSVADVAAHHYPIVPARWLVKDSFDSVAKIGAIGAPLLVVQGERDSVIPTRFGRKLFAAAAHPKEGVWIENADHNDLYDYGAGKAVVAYLKGLFAAAP